MTKKANVKNGITNPNINENPSISGKTGENLNEDILAILEKEGPILDNTEGRTNREEKRYNELDKYIKIFGLLPSELEEEFQRLGKKRNMQNSIEEIKDNLEISQEIEDFRKTWEEKIEGLGDETKNKIIEATNRISTEIRIEPDGSRRIGMKIGGKEYKILDVNMETHTDDIYRSRYKYRWGEKHEVKLGGMIGDCVDKWANQKLKEYVKEKEREGFHIPKIEEMRSLLNELGEAAGIIGEKNQIAMLMYLTGILYGRYWLTMGDGDKSDSEADSRLSLRCLNITREFVCVKNYNNIEASLWMMANSKV